MATNAETMDEIVYGAPEESTFDVPAPDDPDRWQPLLPMPYRMIDELLTEALDSCMFQVYMKAEAKRNLAPAAVIDDESGTPNVRPAQKTALPPALAAAPIALLAGAGEGMLAAVLEPTAADGAASLWLWDMEAADEEPQQIGTPRAGLACVQLLALPIPTSYGGSRRQRLVLVCATPEPAQPDPEEGATKEAAAPPADDAAQILIVDVGLSASDAWFAQPIAEISVASYATAALQATLSADVCHLALSLSDGTLVAYRLSKPLPPPAPPKEGLGAAKDEPPPPPAPTPPELLLSVPPPPTPEPTGSAAAAAAAPTPEAMQAHLHFLLSPAPRTVAQPLSWQACGLLWWRSAEAKLFQSFWPKADAPPPPAEGGEEGGGGGGAAGPPEALEWALPFAPTASCVSKDSLSVATGLADGSVVLWDTSLRAERLVLQKHAAAVTHVAMLPDKPLLLSLAADHTLHCYDVSPDAETGQGKLVFRRRLPPDVAPSWLRVSSVMPLALLGDAADASVRVFDTNGDLIAYLRADDGAALALAAPGACAHADTPRAQLVCVAATAAPTDADADAPTGDDAAAAAATEEAAAPADDAAAAAAAASSVSLVTFAAPDVVLGAYPQLAGALAAAGAEATPAQLRQLLGRYTHAQRTDAALLASDPMLSGGGSLGGRKGSIGGSRRGGGAGAGRSQRRPSRGASMFAGSEGGVSRGGDSSSTLGAGPPAAAGGGARRDASGLSESALRARQGSAGAASSNGSFAGPRGGGSVGGGSQISGSRGGGGSRCGGGSERSFGGGGGGGGSVSGSVTSSAAGSEGGRGGGGAESVDIVGKVQRRQRSLRAGRFAREARVTRRWAELKTMGQQMANPGAVQ